MMFKDTFSIPRGYLPISKPVKIHGYVWFLFIFFILYRLLLSLNPLEEGYAYLVAIIILRLLWYRGLSSVFLFIMGIHWLQVYMFLVWNNFYGWKINEYYWTGGNAYWLSMTGILLMTLVFHCFLVKTKDIEISRILRELQHFSSPRILWLYFVLTVFQGIMFYWAVRIPTVGQMIFWVMDLRDVLLLLYALVVWVKKEPKWILWILILSYFLLSLSNYFGGYKSIFILFGLLILMLIRLVNFKIFFAGLLIGAVLLIMSITWLAVRDDYRAFLNQGNGKQVIVVSKQEAIDKLFHLVEEITPHQLYKAFENFIYRVQYLQYFSLTMERVPYDIPYQGGQLMLSNLEFVLVPRILDPDKPTLDPSQKTSYYTGMHVAGMKEGTSISLGYFVDFYIDFGPIGMFLMILLYAILLGFLYTYFVHNLTGFLSINQLILIVFFSKFYLFESDAIAVFGGLYSMIITLLFLKWLLIPGFIRYLAGGRRNHLMQRKRIIILRA